MSSECRPFGLNNQSLIKSRYIFQEIKEKVEARALGISQLAAEVSSKVALDGEEQINGK